MANVTQTIPNLSQGISQQPDEYKVPGQVSDLTNALPDITQGLIKRPAGKFVASLSDGTNNSYTTGKWFHYYRDENEQYIGQVIRRNGHADDGKIRIWDCQTGAEKTVVNGIGNFTYLIHTGDEDIQTLTLNDFTYINNRSITTEMDTTIEPNVNFGKEIFVELKSISYAKQYALNIFDNTNTSTVTTATRINVELVSSSNSYCDSAFKMQAHADRGANEFRCGEPSGDGRDSFAPNVGTRIFSVDSNKELVDTAAIGGTLANGNLSDINYTYNVSIYKKAFGGTYSQSGTTVTVTTATPHGLSAGTQMYFDILTGNAVDKTTTIATVPSSTTFTFTADASLTTSGNINSSEINQTGRKNLYFRIATTGQSTPYGAGSNVTYQARYTTTYDLLHGGEGWLTGDFFYVWMKDAYYKITVEASSESIVQANLALVRPNPTPFDTETTITAESILGDIRTAIIADGNFTNSDITTIGTGLHIKKTTAFNASTPVGELLNVVAGKVQDVGDLPSQCKHGMVVEVVNSVADEDNHYVKFFGNNDKDGEGTWEECAKPGRTIRLKRSKMPVLLIRTADGNFRLTELDGSNYTISGTQYSAPQWDDALVGDDVTNPEPSFIGKSISKLLFFRNRFSILADENIVMSRPGDFTNFFAKSAIQLIASDPIDIAASSEYPAVLYDGIQTNTGLILFSKNQQFMLTTDSDVFSPATAKINALSTYNFNFATNPISLGTTIGFLDNAGKFSRFFEMSQLQREGEPEIIEQSAVVSKLFEKDLKLISNSRENSVVFFSEEGTSTLYGYRYFDNIRERKMAAWFKWTVTGTIVFHCMQDDNLFVVVRNNGKEQLLKYAIKMDSNTLAIAENRVHLDHLMSTSGWTYNATTGKSTKAKPTGLESTNQLAAYDVDAGNNLGRFGLITINGSNLELDGDWSGETFLIGYQYTMEVTLPTIYVTRQEGDAYRADSRANTILHRASFAFGPIGLYETTLTRTGRNDYTELFEVGLANQYQANTASIVNNNKLYSVPIYDRNTNVSLKLKSTHPTPANILYMTWEGVYNNNFYTRV
nr:tail tube protein B [uncultured Mediterranean phage uvMED]BAR27108.1 tail tube protein B [uncultured Mediterranean phage uvMED]